MAVGEGRVSWRDAPPVKYLYKYPQAAYPYDDLIQTNRRRSRQEFEHELLDTGLFNEDRYFDVFVEYAKVAPEAHSIETLNDATTSQHAELVAILRDLTRNGKAE
ncbi:MAG TPA: hypothetical protein VMA53_02840 [Stellaceae bacterium]|nr:hypothetical protein [Stellaceae bacterium]